MQQQLAVHMLECIAAEEVAARARPPTTGLLLSRCACRWGGGGASVHPLGRPRGGSRSLTHKRAATAALLKTTVR